MFVLESLRLDIWMPDMPHTIQVESQKEEGTNQRQSNIGRIEPIVIVTIQN